MHFFDGIFALIELKNNQFLLTITANEKWKRPLVAGDGPLSSALNGHCSILLHSKIYVIGGVGVQGEFDMKYIYVMNLINPSERKNLLDHFLTEVKFLVS